MTLSLLDRLVIVAYLLLTLAIGVLASRRREGDDEYFLGGRRMPWFVVGLSLIATMLSSLAYLSEPGEVWQSGVTQMWGKTLAVPFEMVFVYVVCIPFLMRFRWVMPASLAATLGIAFFLSRFSALPSVELDGLTWSTRRRLVPVPVAGPGSRP